MTDGDAEDHRPPCSPAHWVSTPRRLILVFAGYFLLQCVVRLLASPTLDLDESEQLVATQRLAWGYGPQPPLYSWLQYPLVRWLGPSILALTLLKNALLFSLYVVTYHNARCLTRNHWLATLAAVSLLFLPQIAWESQRDLTHSVLVTLCAAITFNVLIRLKRNPSPGGFLALGICAGLGILSKYSFLLFLAGLVAGAVLERHWRHALLHRHVWIALLTAAIVMLPHTLWVLEHPQAVLGAAREFQITHHWPRWQVLERGLLSLIIAVVAHAGLLLGLFALASQRKPASAPPPSPDPAATRLILYGLGAMGTLLLAAICFGGVTRFKDRWFMPLLAWLPVLLVSGLGSRLESRRITGLLGLGVVVATFVTLAIPGRVWFAAALKHPHELNVPFQELVKGLPNPDQFKVIIAANNWLAGNLKLCLPGVQVFSPQLVMTADLAADTECLVVWDATSSDEPGPRQAARLEALLGPELCRYPARYVSAPLLHYPTKQARLGFKLFRVEHSAGLNPG
jgi:4-amino-4-deoxy-L-arabinose transferase-like glycosyltransferase